jgi:glc operon protein GlcG
MMGACKAEAEKNDWKVAIAIVEDGGALLLFERLDGASALTEAAALGKAQAAAAFRSPSRLAAEMLTQHGGLLKLCPGLPLAGGMPVMYRGECVGAIGVSGVQGHEDEQIAGVGAAAVGWNSRRRMKRRSFVVLIGLIPATMIVPKLPKPARTFALQPAVGSKCADFYYCDGMYPSQSIYELISQALAVSKILG